MTDEQYHKIKAELPRVAWGWNVHEHDTIGMSPRSRGFMAARPSLSRKRWYSATTENQLLAPSSSWRRSTALWPRRTPRTYMRKLYADRLNARSAGGKT